MVDARIPYVLVVKKFIFFQKNLKFMCHFESSVSNMYRLIFKFDFDLDDDLYWIQASLTK
jgi:hypothetical protein